MSSGFFTAMGGTWRWGVWHAAPERRKRARPLWMLFPSNRVGSGRPFSREGGNLCRQFYRSIPGPASPRSALAIKDVSPLFWCGSSCLQHYHGVCDLASSSRCSRKRYVRGSCFAPSIVPAWSARAENHHFPRQYDIDRLGGIMTLPPPTRDHAIGAGISW